MPTLDFLKNVLVDYENSLRQTGRTSRLIETARVRGSTIVCHHHIFASMLRTEYGVAAISLDTYLNADYHRGGVKTEYLFDSPAEYEIIKRKLEEADKIMKGETNGIFSR